MNSDPTPAVGIGGTIATILLENINGVVSILVGLATLGYVITKWVWVIRNRKDRD